MDRKSNVALSQTAFALWWRTLFRVMNVPREKWFFFRQTCLKR